MTKSTLCTTPYELNAFEKGLDTCYGMSRPALRQIGYHHDNKAVIGYVKAMAYRTELSEELTMEAEDIALNINTGYFDGWTEKALNAYIKNLVVDVVGRKCYLTLAINIRNVNRVIGGLTWDHVQQVPFTNKITWRRGRG
jgi:hypothetical protein